MKEFVFKVARFISKVTGFGVDKVLHFGACYVATLSGAFIGIIPAIMFAFGLAIGKEYGDSQAVGNYWRWGDIVADTIGIVFGALTVGFLNNIL